MARRPEAPEAPAADTAAYDRAAEPVLRLIDRFDDHARDGERKLLEQAGALLDRFEVQAERHGAPRAGVKPARYALAVLLDQRARATRGVSLETWGALAGRHLFDGRDMSLARIRDFHDTAARQGAEYTGLAGFLAAMIARAERHRQGGTRHGRASRGWGWWAFGAAVFLVLSLAGYAAFLEYRFQARLSAGFEAEALEIGLDRDQPMGELAARLTRLQEATDRVARAAARAPFRRALRLPLVDSETRARAAYAQAVNRHMPGALAAAIEELVATEGDGLKLYDAMRAWSVLTGEAAWQPGYLAGWLETYEARLDVPGLARHLPALAGASPDLVPQDAVLMDQARDFAAEPQEAARAWLELLRADDMRALPRWQPEAAVPGLGVVLVRRSGRPLDEGVPGLFTAAGWDHARKFGVGVAVQKARALAPVITGQTLPMQNDAPDLLLDRLHRETLAAWQGWLADLRVRPFGERDAAIVVSGTLAQAENPLTRLLREVWVQAGGNDRSRGHARQLRLATVFGPMIQYVEQGRMAEIARLFSTLNVALASMDVNRERGTERLMSVQDRARSVAALKSAPRIVVQIAEDVLAQSSRPDTGLSSNPLTRQWQQSVYPLCRDVMTGRYPFADGPDAAAGDLAALLGPQGALTVFVQGAARPYLETDTSPWRWKPEARFAGLTPESAAFLERAVQVSGGLFDGTGRMRHGMTLAALAERGQTLFAIGGQAEPVRATGAAARLDWPGPDPAAGVEVSFRDGAENARLIHPGPWGLMRLIDGLRLRPRDGGQRVLLDLRTDAGRIFLELGFEAPLNPVSVRPALRGLTCPPVL